MYKKQAEAVDFFHKEVYLEHFKGKKEFKNFPVEFFSLEMYQSLVGLLNYIATQGRFDIQYHTSTLSQYSICPNVFHFAQAVQVFRYLYKTIDTVYKYPKRQFDYSHDILTLRVYTDASRLTYTSQGGYIILADERV